MRQRCREGPRRGDVRDWMGVHSLRNAAPSTSRTDDRAFGTAPRIDFGFSRPIGLGSAGVSRRPVAGPANDGGWRGRR